CIQGALAAHQWAGAPIKNILDIGTGTGLLSLMLAQKLTGAAITAIEIEPSATEQAMENFGLSPWIQRLSVQQKALQTFEPGQTFDAIICNPPFFHKHLNSAMEPRNKARHDETLSKADLAGHVTQLLNDSGMFCVLYPNTEWQSWVANAADAGL